MLQIKNNLMIRRVMRGYMQEQLCKELRKFDERCTQGEISAYEKGERLPSLDRTLLIAKILKCTLKDIYDLSGDFSQLDLDNKEEEEKAEE